MGLFGPPDVDRIKRKRDIKGLQAALAYRKSAAVRRSAALAISEIADGLPPSGLANLVSPLIAALEDSDSSVVKAAIHALGTLGQPAFLPLISTLRSPVERIREAAVLSIGRGISTIADATLLSLSIDPLIGLVQAPAAGTRRAAAWVLGRLIPRLEPAQRSLPLDTLMIALRDHAVEVREAAAASLGHSSESRAVRPLVTAMEDESAVVRKTAAEGLELLGWSPSSPIETASFHIARQEWQAAAQAGPQAANLLIRIIFSADQPSRLAAIQVLGLTGSPDAVPPLVDALKDPDQVVRAAAAAALEQAGDPQVVDALLKAVRDNDREVRKAVARALAHTDDERAVPPLINMLRTRDPDLVEIAVEALAGLGSNSVFHLVQMLSDPDNHQRDLAARALKRVGSPAVLALTECMRNAPAPANVLAARVLGEIGDPSAVWPLISELKNETLAQACVQSLGKIKDGRAVQPLLDLINSDSPEYIQQAAALALGAIGDPQALSPLIQLLRAHKRAIRADAAAALIQLYRSGSLNIGQKLKILEQQDRIKEKHTDTTSHQDEARSSDWHVDQNFHQDSGIGLDFPTSSR